jgi:glucan-binding YG repeat protein
VIRCGFQNIGGKQYYFWHKTEKGHYSRTMATGWNTINGFKYYMGKDGAIRTGWQTIGGKKYYFWPKTEKGHYKGTLRK